MSDERPIEKLLRRYAKKRRDAAGAPELHPATRRLLQGEVARQYPANAGGSASFTALLKSGLPWFAVSTAMLILSGVGLWMVLGTKERHLAMSTAPATAESIPAATPGMSRNEPAAAPAAIAMQSDAAQAREMAAVSRAAAPPPASAPPPVLSDASRFAVDTARPATPTDQFHSTMALAEGHADASARELFARKAAPAVAATPLPPTNGRRGGGGESADTARMRQVEAAAALAATQPLPAGAPMKFKAAGELAKSEARAVAGADRSGAYELGLRDGEREDRPEFSQSFANNALPAARADRSVKDGTATATVLLNFQVEQTGQRLRVIDHDGSVYRGEIVALGDLAEEKKSALRPAPATKSFERLNAARVANTQNYFYRVAGTNRTLQQPVVFSWNFVSPSNTLTPQQPQLLGGAFGTGQKDSSPAQNVMPSNATINGVAEVQGRQIEVNAVPLQK